MTTTAVPGVPRGRSRFPNAIQMEWIKLRSLRSTWWTLAVSAAGAIGIAIAVGRSTKDATGDLTNNVLAGIIPCLLTIGVLGVVTMTGEYSSGMIRATLAVVPDRPLLLAAKAAVFGAVTLVVGEAAAFVSFFAGGAALPDTIAAPTLAQPGVLRAVVLAGAGISLVGLIGMGLGAVIRHSPAAIAVLVGGVYVAAQYVAMIARPLMPYVPIAIVGNSLSVVRTETMDGITPLAPWAGLGMLCLYAAVTLGAGAWLLVRRDA